MTFLEEKMPEIKRLCDTHQVARLYAFGSVIRPDFSESSDADLMVDLDIKSPLERGRTLWNLWDEFEKIFSRRVDLLTEESLKNPYLRMNIERNRQIIYTK